MASRILIIEDDAAIRESLEMVLLAEGYETEIASNGKEGLERLRAEAAQLPKLILLDLTMPIMTGTEFLEIQKSDPALKPIPTVVFTAAGNRGKPELADDFVRKPIALDDLLAVIQKYA